MSGSKVAKEPFVASRTEWLNLLVIGSFALLTIAALTLVKGNAGRGSDLTSSYVGCRLFVDGQVKGDAGHLYSQSETNYDLVDDPVWKHATAGRGFPPDLALPPYVQTPLWAYGLQPLCAATHWPTFNRIFVVVLVLSFAGMLWLTGRYWTPRLFHPLWMAVVCLLVPLEPFQYSVVLTQTHIPFMLMALVAVLLARRGFVRWAGLLLALAAAVKITPGLLAIYWVMTRQYKALVSFAVSSAGLLALTAVLTGPGTVAAWLRSMSRVSNILLVAWNNESFAAWAMGGHYAKAELWRWHSLPLPPAVKLVSLGLLVASAVAGGYLDRRMAYRGAEQPPYGAVLTLIGATLFTPIAWTHYFVLLIVPVMLALDEHLRRRTPVLAGAVAVMVLLSAYEFVYIHAVRLRLALPYLARTEFYAGLIAMAVLVYLHVRRMRENAPGEPLLS